MGWISLWRLKVFYIPAIFFITGCSITPTESPLPPELANYPIDVKRDISPAMLERQEFLKSRGLYLNRYSQLNDIQSGSVPFCPILGIEAHRGGNGWPENSLSAIKAATARPYLSIEIDVMLSGDDKWIVHHDDSPGRVSQHPKNMNRSLRRSNAAYWNEIFLLDPVTLSRSSERLPSMDKILRAFAKTAQLGQRINIEVKHNITELQGKQLKDQINKHLNDNQYIISSIEIGALKAVRAYSDDVYLAIVELGTAESMKQSLNAKGKRIQSDYFRKLAMRNYNANRKRWSTVSGMKDLVSRIGKNAGIHMDIRQYVADPSVKQRAERLGLRDIATYTINDNDYHTGRLKHLAKIGKLPHRAITDEDPVRLCGILGGLPSYPPYVSNSQVGNAYSQLPNDANLITLNGQLDYVAQGVYETWSGDIKTLPSAQTAQPTTRKARRVSNSDSYNDDTSAPADETMNINTGGTIKLSLPGS